MSDERWIVRPRPNSLARVRLFCFPVAGGNPTSFADWPDALPDDVEVCAIQFPGRLQRMRETPYTRMPLAIAELERAVLPYLDLPYAIFGTCTGSLAGYELAQRLVRVHGMPPSHLVVSCCRAPHLPDRDAPIHGLSEEALWCELERLGGTPPIVAANPEIKGLLSPLLRADFELAETYRYRESPPLACPITALAGRDDRVVSADENAAWAEHTSAAFALHTLPGGHYLLDGAADAVVAAVTTALAGVESGSVVHA